MNIKTGIIIFLSLIIFFIVTTVTINKSYMHTDPDDINLLKTFYGKNYEIESFEDLIIAQHFTLEKIPHVEDQKFFKDKLLLDQITKLKFGACYDRSFILQKLLIANNKPVVPIYLFHNKKHTTPFNFFKKGLLSHSIFKTKINGDWVYVETNVKMKSFKILSMDEYFLADYKIVPNHSLFIEHLMNRNGVFLGPRYLPDFY
jgi:hypothetical protein